MMGVHHHSPNVIMAKMLVVAASCLSTKIPLIGVIKKQRSFVVPRTVSPVHHLDKNATIPSFFQAIASGIVIE
jgi:hypothetical protein